MTQVGEERMSTLVTVVTAVKNGADTLADTLASCLTQGVPLDQLQVVVVNDGSEDTTSSVLREFSGRLPGLEVIEHQVSRGVSASRNEALERAEGRYVTFIDGDDWYAPDHLSTMLEGLERLGVDFVKSDFVMVKGFGRTLNRAPCAVRGVRLDPREYINPPEMSTMVDYAATWTGVYRRNLLERGMLHFNPVLRTAEDRPWTWRLHLDSESFAVLNAPGICYRRGGVDSSLTQVFDDRQLDFIPAFADAFALIRADREPDRWWPKAARNFLGILHHHTQRADKMSAQVRKQMFARAVGTIELIPRDKLDLVLATFGDDRVDRLAPALRPILHRK